MRERKEKGRVKGKCREKERGKGGRRKLEAEDQITYTL